MSVSAATNKWLKMADSETVTSGGGVSITSGDDNTAKVNEKPKAEDAGSNVKSSTSKQDPT
jgi:hypothetical protein